MMDVLHTMYKNRLKIHSLECPPTYYAQSM
jgi:hypothetical protein